MARNNATNDGSLSAGLITTNGAGTLSSTALPVSIANGGTNATSMATTDGVVYYDGTRLVTTAVGTATNVLTSNGAGVAPTFQAASGSITLTGNTGGGLTSSSFTITTGASNANGTATFAGSGSTLTLNPSDSLNDTAWGAGSLGGGVLTGSAGGNCLFGTNTGQFISTALFNNFFGDLAGVGIVGTPMTSSKNVGIGANSLNALTTGSGDNVAIGDQAAKFITTGAFNTIIGGSAGTNYSGAESSNILIGYNVPGTNSETHVLRIGNGTGASTAGNVNSCFVSGITGITVTGTAVLVSASNQLGIAVSSKRFKNDIQVMGSSSDVIYKLRPVTFTWDRNSAPGLEDASQDRQCGLIAEEVAEILPQVVGFEKDGRPLNVNYGDLTSLLVNEIQKIRTRIEALESK